MTQECSHDSYSKYKELIEPLRQRAHELGYAITVHGTLKRDIDLVAVPWVAEASDPWTLAEALRQVAERINGFAFINPREHDDYHQAGQPGHKPHGRLVWSFHLGGGPYIDLSVFPPSNTPYTHSIEICRLTQEHGNYRPEYKHHRSQ